MSTNTPFSPNHVAAALCRTTFSSKWLDAYNPDCVLCPWGRHKDVNAWVIANNLNNYHYTEKTEGIFCDVGHFARANGFAYQSTDLLDDQQMYPIYQAMILAARAATRPLIIFDETLPFMKIDHILFILNAFPLYGITNWSLGHGKAICYKQVIRAREHVEMIQARAYDTFWVQATDVDPWYVESPFVSALLDYGHVNLCDSIEHVQLATITESGVSVLQLSLHPGLKLPILKPNINFQSLQATYCAFLYKGHPISIPVQLLNNYLANIKDSSKIEAISPYLGHLYRHSAYTPSDIATIISHSASAYRNFSEREWLADHWNTPEGILYIFSYVLLPTTSFNPHTFRLKIFDDPQSYREMIIGCSAATVVTVTSLIAICSWSNELYSSLVSFATHLQTTCAKKVSNIKKGLALIVDTIELLGFSFIGCVGRVASLTINTIALPMVFYSVYDVFTSKTKTALLRFITERMEKSFFTDLMTIINSRHVCFNLAMKTKPFLSLQEVIAVLWEELNNLAPLLSPLTGGALIAARLLIMINEMIDDLQCARPYSRILTRLLVHLPPLLFSILLYAATLTISNPVVLGLISLFAILAFLLSSTHHCYNNFAATADAIIPEDDDDQRHIYNDEEMALLKLNAINKEEQAAYLALFEKTKALSFESLQLKAQEALTNVHHAFHYCYTYVKRQVTWENFFDAFWTLTGFGYEAAAAAGEALKFIKSIFVRVPTYPKHVDPAVPLNSKQVLVNPKTAPTALSNPPTNTPPSSSSAPPNPNPPPSQPPASSAPPTHTPPQALDQNTPPPFSSDLPTQVHHSAEQPKPISQTTQPSQTSPSNTPPVENAPSTPPLVRASSAPSITSTPSSPPPTPAISSQQPSSSQVNQPSSQDNVSQAASPSQQMGGTITPADMQTFFSQNIPFPSSSVSSSSEQPTTDEEDEGDDPASDNEMEEEEVDDPPPAASTSSYTCTTSTPPSSSTQQTQSAPVTPRSTSAHQEIVPATPKHVSRLIDPSDPSNASTDEFDNMLDTMQELGGTPLVDRAIEERDIRRRERNDKIESYKKLAQARPALKLQSVTASEIITAFTSHLNLCPGRHVIMGNTIYIEGVARTGKTSFVMQTLLIEELLTGALVIVPNSALKTVWDAFTAIEYDQFSDQEATVVVIDEWWGFSTSALQTIQKKATLVICIGDFQQVTLSQALCDLYSTPDQRKRDLQKENREHKWQSKQKRNVARAFYQLGGFYQYNGLPASYAHCLQNNFPHPFAERINFSNPSGNDSLFVEIVDAKNLKNMSEETKTTLRTVLKTPTLVNSMKDKSILEELFGKEISENVRLLNACQGMQDAPKQIITFSHLSSAYHYFEKGFKDDWSTDDISRENRRAKHYTLLTRSTEAIKFFGPASWKPLFQDTPLPVQVQDHYRDYEISRYPLMIPKINFRSIAKTDKAYLKYAMLSWMFQPLVRAYWCAKKRDSKAQPIVIDYAPGEGRLASLWNAKSVPTNLPTTFINPCDLAIFDVPVGSSFSWEAYVQTILDPHHDMVLCKRYSYNNKLIKAERTYSFPVRYLAQSVRGATTEIYDLHIGRRQLVEASAEDYHFPTVMSWFDQNEENLGDTIRINFTGIGFPINQFNLSTMPITVSLTECLAYFFKLDAKRGQPTWIISLTQPVTAVRQKTITSCSSPPYPISQMPHHSSFEMQYNPRFWPPVPREWAEHVWRFHPVAPVWFPGSEGGWFVQCPMTRRMWVYPQPYSCRYPPFATVPTCSFTKKFDLQELIDNNPPILAAVQMPSEAALDQLINVPPPPIAQPLTVENFHGNKQFRAVSLLPSSGEFAPPFVPNAYARHPLNDLQAAYHRLLRTKTVNPQQVQWLLNRPATTFYNWWEVNNIINPKDFVDCRTWLKGFPSNRTKVFIRAANQLQNIFDSFPARGDAFTKWDEVLNTPAPVQKEKRNRCLVNPSAKRLVDMGAFAQTLENHFRRQFNCFSEKFFVSGASNVEIAYFASLCEGMEVCSADVSGMDASYFKEVFELLFSLLLHCLNPDDRPMWLKKLRELLHVTVTNLENKNAGIRQIFFQLSTKGELPTGDNLTLLFNSLFSLVLITLAEMHSGITVRLMFVGDDHWFAAPDLTLFLQSYQIITQILDMKTTFELSHWSASEFCSQVFYKTQPYTFKKTIKTNEGDVPFEFHMDWILDWQPYRALKTLNYSTSNPVPFDKYIPQFLKSISMHSEVPIFSKYYQFLVAKYGCVDELSDWYYRKFPEISFKIQATVWWKLDTLWWNAISSLRDNALPYDVQRANRDTDGLLFEAGIADVINNYDTVPRYTPDATNAVEKSKTNNRHRRPKQPIDYTIIDAITLRNRGSFLF